MAQTFQPNEYIVRQSQIKVALDFLIEKEKNLTTE